MRIQIWILGFKGLTEEKIIGKLSLGRPKSLNTGLTCNSVYYYFSDFCLIEGSHLIDSCSGLSKSF